MLAYAPGARVEIRDELFTLPACASERGIAELQLDGIPSMDLTTAIKDEINVKNE